MLLLSIALLAGCASPVRPQGEAIAKLQRVAVVFADDGDFVVYDERANAITTPFSITGALLSSVGNYSQDRAREQQLREFVESPSCRKSFQTAFEDTLRKAGRPTVQVVAQRTDAKQAHYDAALEFEILDCGFRMINQMSNEIAAFIVMRAKLVMADGRVAWDDSESVISSRRSTIYDLQSDPDFARSIFEAALNDAGRRMAYNLIYP
jgi:hypothetical protein